MGDVKRITRSDEVYDVSPQEREVIEYRDKRRLALRQQYLREMHHPDSPAGHIFDPAIQRHYSAKFAYERNFKPTVRNFLTSTCMSLGLIGVTYWYIKVNRDKQEEEYRTGQVSYRDRRGKFV